MSIKTNKHTDPSPLDRRANAAAERIAQKHGLMNRARNVWHSMANELLAEVQPAIQDQARADADQLAKERLRGILALPEAKGRRELAERLALETDSTVEQIRSMLSSTPTQAEHDPLARLMSGKTPGINSDCDDYDGGDSEAELARQILTSDQEAA